MQEATGAPHPALLNKTPLRREDDLYYVGFCVLGGRRMYSQAGPQPIVYSEIVSYMDENDVYGLDLRDAFIEHIESMDVIEMNHRVKKAKAK